MTTWSEWIPWANVASGIVIAMLGLWALSIRPRRGGVLAFSFVCLVWGAQVATANMSRVVTDVPTALFWMRWTTVFVIFLYVPLLALASALARPWRRPQTMWLVAASLPAVLMLVWVLADPSLIIERASLQPDGTWEVRMGALYVPAAAFSAIGAFALALGVILWRTLRASTRLEQRQMVWLAAAFALYVGYKSVETLGYLDPQWRAIYGQRPLLDRLALAGNSILGILAILLAAGLAAVRRDLPARGLLAFCCAAPVLVGAFEVFLFMAGGPDLETLFLWRLGFAGLAGYAILHFRLFNAELHVRSAAPLASYALVSVLGVALFWSLFDGMLVGRPTVGGVATAALMAACVPVVRWSGDRIERRFPSLHDEARLYARKLEVYRALLESSPMDEDGSLDSSEVRRLQRRLGLSSREHRILMAVAEAERSQSTVERSRTLVPGRSVSGYQVERLLGRGSHGLVYLARSKEGRQVVLKDLRIEWASHEPTRRRLERELQLLGSLDHPHLVPLLDVVRAGRDQRPILVLAYMPGGSLGDRLRDGRAPAADAVRWVQDALGGLGELHRHGIVHRDIKPDNILFDEAGVARLVDLGVAATLDPEATQLTRAGEQPGTLMFMSPEQARGASVGPESDLYSLAVVLYRSLTGRSHVDLFGLDAFQARQALQDRSPILPADGIPAALVPVLAKCLAHDPSERPSSAQAMAKMLAKAAKKLPKPTPAVEAPALEKTWTPPTARAPGGPQPV